MDEYRSETEERPVPFTHLVTIAQTADNPERAAEMLRRGGYEEAARDPEKLRQDLTYARNWAEEWAPEPLKLGILDLSEAAEMAKGLDEHQLRYLEEVATKLREDMDEAALQSLLYSSAVELGLRPKKAFAAVYAVLLGRKSGPKAGPFIANIGVDMARERFSSVIRDTTASGDKR
jgi:lysyl-tRNA synthetase class 1